MPSPERIWVGGYTAELGGTAPGVSAAGLAPDGAIAALGPVAAAASPSFVAEHPSLPVLYAVAEHDSTVRAFAITAGGGLEPLGAPVSAGVGPCHVAVEPHGRFAVVACYGSGDVIAFPLDGVTGALGAGLAAARARDPYARGSSVDRADPDRAARPAGSDAVPAAGDRGETGDEVRASRAHFCQFLPDGRLLTTDLGFDLARVWRCSDPAGVLELDHEVVFPRGAGPRHAAVAPGGRGYVVGESSVAVYVLAVGRDGRYAIAASSPLRSGAPEPGEYAAHVSLSSDGAVLYAPVRGANVVAVLRVGADGAPAPVAEVPSGGNWPRHHLVAGGRLYVANQRSNEITVFTLDADGLPGAIVQRCATGSPAVLVPARAQVG